MGANRWFGFYIIYIYLYIYIYIYIYIYFRDFVFELLSLLNLFAFFTQKIQVFAHVTILVQNFYVASVLSID